MPFTPLRTPLMKSSYPLGMHMLGQFAVERRGVEPKQRLSVVAFLSVPPVVDPPSVSSTASIRGRSDAETAGTLANSPRRGPQPKALQRASNVGSVSKRQPSSSIRTVGRRCAVIRRSVTPGSEPPRRPDRRLLDRPVERVVGDLLPARLRGHQVRTVVLDDLRDRVRLVVLRVRLLDLRRHQMVLAAGDEEQRHAVVVLVVDVRVVLAGMDVGEDAAPRYGRTPGCGSARTGAVPPPRKCVREDVAPLVEREPDGLMAVGRFFSTGKVDLICDSGTTLTPSVGAELIATPAAP